jgi:hypothetical protein
MTDEIADDVSKGTAYRHVQEARAKLDAAAQALGYSDVHRLSLDAAGMDLPRRQEDAVEALTNAQDCLDNGSAEGFIED